MVNLKNIKSKNIIKILNDNIHFVTDLKDAIGECHGIGAFNEDWLKIKIQKIKHVKLHPYKIQYLKNTIMHEIGHALDNTFYNPRNNELFATMFANNIYPGKEFDSRAWTRYSILKKDNITAISRYEMNKIVKQYIDENIEEILLIIDWVETNHIKAIIK